MPENSTHSKTVHERSALRGKPAVPARKSGFSHARPGHHDAPTAPKQLAKEGKRFVRAKKRRIRLKGEA